MVKKVSLLIIFTLLLIKLNEQKIAFKDNQRKTLPLSSAKSQFLGTNLSKVMTINDSAQNQRILAIKIPDLLSKVSIISSLEGAYHIKISNCSLCSLNSSSCQQNNQCICKKGPNFYGNDCSISSQNFQKIKILKDEVVNDIFNHKEEIESANVENIINMINTLSTISETLKLQTIEKIHQITKVCIDLSTQSNYEKVIKIINEIIVNFLKYHGMLKLKQVCQTSQQFMKHISQQLTGDNILELNEKNIGMRIGSIDALNKDSQNEKNFTNRAKINNQIKSQLKNSNGSILSNSDSVKVGNIQYRTELEDQGENSLQSSIYSVIMYNQAGDVLTAQNLSKQNQIQIYFRVQSSEYFKNIKKLIFDTVEITSFEQLQERKVKILKQNPISIRYFDPTTQQWSTEGIQLMEFNQEYIVAKTNHLTDFAGFIGQSIGVLENSNYAVFIKMIQLSGDCLMNNIGFQIMAMLWVLYLVILLMLLILEKQKQTKFSRLQTRKDLMRKNTFEFNKQIQQETPTIKASSKNLMKSGGKIQPMTSFENEMQSIQDDCSRDVKQSQGQIDSDSRFFSLGSRKIKMNEFFRPKQGQTRNSVSILKNANMTTNSDQSKISIQNSQKNNKLLSKKIKKSKFHPQTASTSPQQLQKTTIKRRWKKVGFITKAVKRLENMRVQNSSTRTLGKSIYSEIKNNNMLLNMFVKSSVVFPRSARATVFFLAMILQVFFCALFFQIVEGPQQSMEKQFIENFWIGFWTVLFSILPMLLIVCLFTMPSKKRNLIMQTNDDIDLIQELERQKRNMRLRYCCAYFISIMIMIFASWYVTAFGAWINDLKYAEDFLESSLIALFIDALLLEIGSALIVGIVITLVFKWKCLKFLYFIPICIEIYRIYRNMAGD